MFEITKEIPVTFVPHDLDLWAVGATLFAASASLVVAMLAWRNGKKALVISAEANEREEARLAAEREAVRTRERHEVATAMIRALVAQKTLGIAESGRVPPNGIVSPDERLQTIHRDAELMRVEALARTALFESHPRIRDWFAHVSDHVYAAFLDTECDFWFADEVTEDLLFRIGKWGVEELCTDCLIRHDPSGPLPPLHDSQWCDSDHDFWWAQPDPEQKEPPCTCPSKLEAPRRMVERE